MMIKLVRIITADSPYHGLLALLHTDKDIMIILGDGYTFDYYKEERVPMYDVITNDFDVLFDYIVNNQNELVSNDET